MNLIDLLILGGLAIGAVRGFTTGALRQVVSLVGVVVAFALAFQLMETVGSSVADSLGLADSVAPVVGFIVVFVGVQAIAFGLTRLAEGVLKALHLSIINRMAGGVIGAGKAALLVSALLLVLRATGRPSASARKKASLYAPIVSALPATWSYVSTAWPSANTIIDSFEAPKDWLPQDSENDEHQSSTEAKDRESKKKGS